MKAWWLFVVVACGKQAAPGAGSGSAAPKQLGDAAAVVAIVVDAPPAIDAAPPSTPGVTFALEQPEKLVFAAVDATGVKQTGTVDTGALANWRWLDAHTVIATTRAYGDDAPSALRIVDGRLAETVKGDKSWNDSMTGLVLTKSGEVWIDHCASVSLPPIQCEGEEFIRVFGAKQRTKKKPKDPIIDARRPAPVATPAGIKVAALPDTGAIACTMDGKTVTYPEDPTGMQKSQFVLKKVTWVLGDPLIYETRTDEDNGNDEMIPMTRYFMACTSKPLDDFISFGGTLWGQRSEDATWTVSNGRKVLAKLTGSAIQIAP